MFSCSSSSLLPRTYINSAFSVSGGRFCNSVAFYLLLLLDEIGFCVSSGHLVKKVCCGELISLSTPPKLSLTCHLNLLLCIQQWYIFYRFCDILLCLA